MTAEMQPGVYAGIPNDVYHGGPGISNSGLSLIARSPAHYWAAYMDPSRQRRQATPAMEFGTAVHTAILEPDRFMRDYVVPPYFNLRTNAGKDSAAAWARDNPGKVSISQQDFDACKRVRCAVENHAAADILLADGQPELSCYWQDFAGGGAPVLCKCRPDFLTNDGWIVDVKTTEDARQEAFARSIYNYRYFVQAPWYFDGVAMSTGVQPRGFIFLTIEKSPPYAIAVYVASPKMMQAGRVEYQRNLAAYRECLATDWWPAYPEEIVPIDLPAWAQSAAARQVI